MNRKDFLNLSIGDIVISKRRRGGIMKTFKVADYSNYSLQDCFFLQPKWKARGIISRDELKILLKDKNNLPCWIRFHNKPKDYVTIDGHYWIEISQCGLRPHKVYIDDSNGLLGIGYKINSKEFTIRVSLDSTEIEEDIKGAIRRQINRTLGIEI